MLFMKQCLYGKGVFAGRGFRKGDKILAFSGPVIHRSQLPIPILPENDYYLQIGEDFFLGPSGEPDDFVNHSCDPNAGVIVQFNSAILLAIHPIKWGDEIFFDYSTTMDNAPCEIDCHCKSPSCRGRIENFLLLPVPVQQKYVQLGIVPDYILKKFLKKYAASRRIINTPIRRLISC